MAVEKASPANGKERVAERARVPLSVRRQTYEVPEIPGYHLHWFRGTAKRIQEALDAWYTFVEEGEISTHNFDIGGDAKKSGNSDLGSRVSQLAGSEVGSDGQPLRMYLMKLPLEYYEEDQKLQAERSEQIRQALNNGSIGMSGVSNADYQAQIKQKSNILAPKPIRR